MVQLAPTVAVLSPNSLPYGMDIGEKGTAILVLAEEVIMSCIVPAELNAGLQLLSATPSVAGRLTPCSHLQVIANAPDLGVHEAHIVKKLAFAGMEIERL